MALNPILDGIKRGFDMIVDPGKQSRLREDLALEHGETLYHANYHEVIEATAQFTASFLQDTRCSANDFLNAVLKLDKTHRGSRQVFSILDDHIYQMSCHVSFLDEISQSHNGGNSIHWEQARSHHKLQAHMGVKDDLKVLTRDTAEQLTDCALQVDDMLLQPRLQNALFVNVLKIAGRTHHEDEQDAPHRITEQLYAAKIKSRDQPVVREMLEHIRDMLDTQSCSLRQLFLANLTGDDNIVSYGEIKTIANNDELLQVTHNFDAAVFTAVYDDICRLDGDIFDSRVQDMMLVASFKT